MIRFIDLAAQYRRLKPEIDDAVGRVLSSGQFVLGEEVVAFEREFAECIGAPFAVAVNSGTSALHLALLAASVGPGDEVITVPFTFIATVASIEYTGARPVFVDIDATSHTLDVGRLEAAITSRTRAIIPVHLYGRPADMDSIVDIANRHGVTVIEDAAQAHGARYKGRAVGSLGDLACFSFYPTKNLGAYGEGGLIATGSPHLARTMRLLRDWGQDAKYQHVLKGFNYRMDALQGAILRVKLRHLEAWNEARRLHAAEYDRQLAGSGVITPAVDPELQHAYHIYAVRTTERDELRSSLHARGIETAVHYPLPIHLQPAYAGLGYRDGDFPQSEALAREVMSLPIYPELTIEAVRCVAEAVGRGVHVQS